MAPEEMKKLLLKFIAPILLIALFHGISSADTEKASQLILRVNNLSCSDCHQVINKRLLQINKNIKISSASHKRFLIITHPNSLKEKEIVRAIQKLGYKVGITTPKQKGSKVAHTQKGSRVTYGYCTSTCSASSKTWKQFYKRYFAKNK